MSSVVEHLLGMCEALGLILSTAYKELNKINVHQQLKKVKKKKDSQLLLSAVLVGFSKCDAPPSDGLL